MDIKLKIIPYSTVRTALEEARENFTEPSQFNSHYHSEAEINAVLPHLSHYPPDTTTGHYEDWIDILAESQRFEDYHVIHLPSYLCRAMVNMQTIWKLRGTVSKEEIDEIVSLFSARKKIAGVEMNEALDGTKTWFVRLDLCSPKDGDGSGPIKTVEELVHRLCTSMRARAEFEINLREKAEVPGKVFLVPFNPRMDPSREWRVFCPPLVRRVSAISQYRWTEPLVCSTAERGFGQLKVRMRGVVEQAEVIYGRIMEHAEMLKKGGKAVVLDTMVKHGFVFDILEPEDGSAFQLVELNGFGAMTGCGPSLFHWINDARVLYGLEEVVEVRVTLE